MVKLEVFDETIEYNGKVYPMFSMEFYNHINVVLGDSGTGKSLFFNSIDSAIRGILPYTYSCKNKGANIEVKAVSSIDDLETAIQGFGKVVVIDEDMVEEIRQSNKLGKLKGSNNYFILLDRQMKIKMDTNINALYVVNRHPIGSKITYTLDKYIDLYKEEINLESIKNIKYFITEDTSSGKLFWEHVFSGLKVLEIEHGGNGSIRESIDKALELYDGDILVALDYDYGAIPISGMYESKDEKYRRVHFIPLESFEEVICNSEFIMSKCPDIFRDMVVNYKEHIDFNAASTGKYFSLLLYTYVKERPPIHTSKRNITKFYSKGMKNFKECFIDDCCAFDRDDCRLRLDGNKLEAMLSNKFAPYRIFISK